MEVQQQQPRWFLYKPNTRRSTLKEGRTTNSPLVQDRSRAQQSTLAGTEATMGQREQGRRSFGKARRCTAGFVLVSMLQLLASAGQCDRLETAFSTRAEQIDREGEPAADRCVEAVRSATTRPLYCFVALCSRGSSLLSEDCLPLLLTASSPTSHDNKIPPRSNVLKNNKNVSFFQEQRQYRCLCADRFEPDGADSSRSEAVRSLLGCLITPGVGHAGLCAEYHFLVCFATDVWFLSRAR